MEVKRPESISPYLEIISWRVIEAPVWGSDTPGLYVKFQNISEDKNIYYKGQFDVYCLDKNDNIIGYFEFWDGYVSLGPQLKYEMLDDMAIGYVPVGTVKMVLLKVKER